MPEFPGRLRTPRLPSAPGTPAVGEIYYNTANNTLYWWNGTAWVTAGTPRVAALPGSPVDGQEIYYVADATNGVLWHLRYNAGSASTYKWEFLGGGALTVAVETVEQTTSSTYVDLTTVGPQITVPLAGDYAFDGAARAYGSQAGATPKAAVKIGATATADTEVVALQHVETATFGGGIGGRRIVRTVAAAATVCKLQYANGGTAGLAAAFVNRVLSAIPVRVG